MAQMDRSWNLAQQVESNASTAALTFEDLFAEQHERLYRALYLIVGNRHEAEELMQDAFVKVLERWDRIDNPAGYLYRSALNSTRSRFRRLQLAAKRTLHSGETEDPFAAADLRDEVVRLLRELPERQRAALVLVSGTVERTTRAPSRAETVTSRQPIRSANARSTSSRLPPTSPAA